jgi:hypothetical protein
MEEVEMKKQVTEPLLDENSRFKFEPMALADIVNLDNHYKDEKSDQPDRIISSRMIVEEFGGSPAICAGLFTNARSGLDETAKET